MASRFLSSFLHRVFRSAIFFGVLGVLVRLGANVLLLPILLRELTKTELAVWWVFVALGGIANLADFGFGQAISRVYSFFWAGAEDVDTEGLPTASAHGGPNYEKLNQLTLATRRLYRRLSAVAIVVLLSIGTWLLARSYRPESIPPIHLVLWIAYALAVGWGIATSYWATACQGINRVRDLQAAYTWSGLVYMISGASFLLMGMGLLAMVLATALRNVLAWWYCMRSYEAALAGKQQMSDGTIDMTMVRRLWPNAWRFGLVSLAVYFVNNGTLLICSYFLGQEATASFGLTSQVGLFLAGFSSLWLSVKWPDLTIMRVQGRSVEMAQVFARRLGLTVVTFVVGSVLLVTVGPQILEWKGTHTQFVKQEYLILYLAYLGQQLIYAQFVSLTYTENASPFFRTAIITGVGLLLLSVLMTPRWGMLGLILAQVISAQPLNSWYPIWRGFRGQPLSVGQFFRAFIGGKYR